MQRLQLTFVHPETGRAPPPQPAGGLAESRSRSDPPLTLPMAFVNEIVSDADIDRYELPFKKGSGRYWTRDKERDIYLWGGKGGNPAFGEEILGRFTLSIKGRKIECLLRPGRGSMKFKEKPFLVKWSSLVDLKPAGLHDFDRELVEGVLKEALMAYGQDGELNEDTPDFVVEFDF